MTLTISFPGTEQTILAEVGGKGYSLIWMVEGLARSARRRAALASS